MAKLRRVAVWLRRALPFGLVAVRVDAPMRMEPATFERDLTDAEIAVIVNAMRWQTEDD